MPEQAELQNIQEFEEGELENTEDGPESAMDSLNDEEKELNPEEQAEKEVEILGEQRERADALSETINDLNEKSKKEHEKIKALRENPPLNLSPDSNIEISSDKNIEDKKEKAEALNEKIEQKKTKLLGLPEGEDFEGEQELEEYKSELDEILEEDGSELSEEEIQKERQKFVDEFIDKSIDDLLDFWKVYIDEYANKEKAISFIKRKTIVEIRKQAKDFIETGKDVESIGFSASIEGAYFDNTKGERIKYLTDYNIKFIDGSKADTVGNKEDEEDLLGKEGKKDVDDAEANGVLTEEQRTNK